MPPHLPHRPPALTVHRHVAHKMPPAPARCTPHIPLTPASHPPATQRESRRTSRAFSLQVAEEITRHVPAVRIMDRASLVVFTNTYVPKWIQRIEGYSRYAEKRLLELQSLVMYESSRETAYEPLYAPAMADILERVAVHLKGTEAAERRLDRHINRRRKRAKRANLAPSRSAFERPAHDRAHDRILSMQPLARDHANRHAPDPALTYGSQITRPQNPRGAARTTADRERVNLFTTLKYRFQGTSAGKCLACLYLDQPNPTGHSFADCPNLPTALAKHRG